MGKETSTATPMRIGSSVAGRSTTTTCPTRASRSPIGQRLVSSERERRPRAGLVRVVAMTDTRNVVAHFVAEEAVAAGRHAGRYVGVCGAMVVPGSLLEDTDRGCRFCRDWAAAR